LVDVVDVATRSRMMSGIKGKNTSPEIFVRKILHAQGYRFRLHVAILPGKPDLVMPKYNVAIFIHGCFWHGHDCRYFKLPATRREFWVNKISKNKHRDQSQQEVLLASGWRVLIVWECAVRRALRSADSKPLLEMVEAFLIGNDSILEIDELHERVVDDAS
jgi:DNA mismatch endonuclease (patch repair protein)